ncbi:hypothetical protein H1235_07760 [Pseudoxanthomonas sp. NC8]|nr:hypothetical protein H1235_07760 [Pseudoxanthomonas sp. NC8]
MLSLNLVLPLLVTAASLALLASGWLLLSSRPGRTVLPPVRYALRETGWRLDRLLRPRAAGREPQASRASAASGRRRHSAGTLPACCWPRWPWPRCSCSPSAGSCCWPSLHAARST